MRHCFDDWGDRALRMRERAAEYSSAQRNVYSRSSLANETDLSDRRAWFAKGPSGAAERRSGLGGASVSKGVGGGSDCRPVLKPRP